jgi:hypothetical protein
VATTIKARAKEPTHDPNHDSCYAVF